MIGHAHDDVIVYPVAGIITTINVCPMRFKATGQEETRELPESRHLVNMQV
jgi:hypothetical protein